MPLESKFERELILELKHRYPGAIILKNDANYLQGFPDRLMLIDNKWAAFEVKAYEKASHRPNQDYYIDLLDRMSFARFVYPDGKEQFLHELQQSLRLGGRARILKR